MPGEAAKKSVRRNSIHDLEFRGKNVLLVNDSICRTTSQQIIQMAAMRRQQVYFASAARRCVSRSCTA